MERFTTRPELHGTFGMVASTHWLASAAGMGVLERGGNASDAAGAAGFVLQVVGPHPDGPGRRPPPQGPRAPPADDRVARRAWRAVRRLRSGRHAGGGDGRVSARRARPAA